MGCSWEKVAIGDTGLRSSPLGLASSYGVGTPDVERGFERGINFFYWGSMRRGSFARAIRNLAPRHRSDMIVVVQSYTRIASLMSLSLHSALRRLQLDYVDFLLLGWWNHLPPARILDAAERLRQQGKARHILISGHQRTSFPQFAKHPTIDAVMVRYNAAHTGAEAEVFPHVNGTTTGVLSYTATRWGSLLDPKHTPPSDPVPQAADCYRFVLSNPHVQVAMAGPQDGTQLDEAMRALDRGPMTEDELAWMRRVGERARRASKRIADGGKA